MSRVPIHSHKNIHQGGKLTITGALDGGLTMVEAGSTPGDGDSDDQGLDFVTKVDGGLETVEAHGTAGAAETLDLAGGNWHSLTLDNHCAITVSGFTADMGCSALVKITQDGTGGWAVTWDPDIVFAGDDQPAQDPDAVSWFVLASDEGDSVIYGFPVGGGGSPASTVEDETTLGITAAVGTDTEYARQDHTHGSPSATTIASAMSTAGFVGALLISDTPSTPLVFADLLQNEAQDDLIYADI